MKIFNIMVFVSLLSLISCSHVNSKREIASNDQNLETKTVTTIMAKQGVKYKVEVFKPTFQGCFTDNGITVSPTEIKEIKETKDNSMYENLNDNVQVATIRFSANYGDRDNCKTPLSSGEITFEFKKPTVVKIIEEAPYSYQLGGASSQYYTFKKGIWTPGQEMEYAEFYKH